MNKIGVKEIVEMCMRNPKGTTPKAAMELMQNANIAECWQVHMKNNTLLLTHKIKSKKRTQEVESTEDLFSNMEILKAIGKLANIQLRGEEDHHINEFIHEINKIDYKKPLLYIV